MEVILQLLLDVILLAGFIGGLVWFFARTPTEGYHAGVRRAAGVLAVLCLVGLAGALSAVIVPAGNVGVVTAFGQVQNDTLPPGLHFRAPFVNAVHLITTRVQPHEFKEIDAASEEYQSVKLTGVMNYHIDGQYASSLYQTVGDDFAAKVLDPAFNDFIKSVVPTYHIGEILGKRDEIRSLAKTQLQANLDKYHIVIDDIYIANIGFSAEYEAAIEAKQVAQQQVETEKQVTQQRVQQAQQAIEQAKGVAQANIETAKGQATATEELARGQAEANRLINESLTPLLIQYTQIARLSPNVQVIYLPEGANFFLNQK